EQRRGRPHHADTHTRLLEHLPPAAALARVVSSWLNRHHTTASLPSAACDGTPRRSHPRTVNSVNFLTVREPSGVADEALGRGHEAGRTQEGLEGGVDP